jgi:purine-binding chemotaxis protein CheW
MNKLVTFRLGDSRFAIPAELVAEVVETGPITHRLPGEKGSHVGLACVRDRWIPVVELASALADAPPLDPDAPGAVVLVLGRERGQLGLRVQDPGEVVAMRVERARQERSEDLLDVDGELVRFVDPATLVASGVMLTGEKGAHMQDSQANPEPLRVVTFQLGDEAFGIDVMGVFEVLPLPELRPVPRAPDFVEGVVEVRDSIVPVIDMRKRFSMPAREHGAPTRLLIVAMGEGRAGLIVDAVPGVIPLPESAVNPPPDFFRGLAGRYLDGLAKDGDRLIILLNVGEILSSKEKIALEKMVSEAASAAKRSGAKPRPKRKKRTPRSTKKKKSDT